MKDRHRHALCLYNYHTIVFNLIDQPHNRHSRPLFPLESLHAPLEIPHSIPFPRRLQHGHQIIFQHIPHVHTSRVHLGLTITGRRDVFKVDMFAITA